MKTLLTRTILIIAIGLSWTGMVHGAQRTATLHVEGMTCVSCPYMVERSLKRVDGVSEADVSMASREAVVTFDTQIVDVDQLTRTTAGAGFPSRLKD